MIYSIHIPKTAGTSFRKALEIRYGDKLALYYGPRDPKTTTLLRRARSKDLAAHVDELADNGFEVLHGHYRVDAVLPRIEDPRRQVWTWLRDPVDRVLSQYDFFKERTLELDPLARQIKSGETDFAAFVKLRSTRNLQHRYLAGLDLSDLAFVGLTERFELGLAMLFGDDAPLLPMRYNAVKEKLAVSSAERARIAALNPYDMQLYAAGLRLFLDRLTTVSDIDFAGRPGTEPKGLLKRLFERVA